MRISTAQFEHRSGDKDYNLSVIEKLPGSFPQGSQAVAFHECSVTGYTFARRLTKEQMLPGGIYSRRKQHTEAYTNSPEI
jgi:predicted amidohydrolase